MFEALAASATLTTMELIAKGYLLRDSSIPYYLHGMLFVTIFSGSKTS